MRVRSLFRGLAVGAAVLVMAACAFAQGRREVTIGLASGSTAVAGGRVAKELGLFERHGLEARFVVMDSSSAALTALISGSLKLIISGVPELIVAQSRGQDVVAVVNTYSGFATSLVLSKALADRLGVSPAAPIGERLRALNGVLIASTSATAIGTVAFKSAAQAAGATVRFTYMAQQAMPAALDSGAIQGFTSSAPYWAMPVAAGSGVLWISGPRGEFPPDYTPQITAQLQTTRAFAQANPELMRDLVAVFADLAEAIDRRPEEVKAAVARLYPGLDARTLDVFFASESLGWRGRALTAQDMAREIGIVRATGAALPNIDRVDPAAMIAPVGN
jgi:ABC-type nitrate/sulfonate/bicarbonate transport system substrate-binding protein